jgi:hypothetical protein
MIGELMPGLASLADRYCLIRSMSHKEIFHDQGMHVCMTGHSKPADNTPYFGSVVAKLRPSVRNIPSYVWLQNLYVDAAGRRYLDGGFLGAAYAPMKFGEDLDNPASEAFRITEFEPSQDMTNGRFLRRLKLLSGLESADQQNAPIAAMRHYQERAIDMLSSPAASRAFDLTREDPRLRDRYGRNPLGQNLLLARRLIEAGVRLVTVNAFAGVAAGDTFIATMAWDMHGAATQKSGIFDTGTFGLGFVLPRFDAAVSALLQDLEVRGLLETTLVVAVGEFGRQPTIVNVPYPGRDHWTLCYSAMLAGAGIRGGLVYGASDPLGYYVKDRPVSPEDFGATLLQALGIRPETHLAWDHFTRPVSSGEPIAELFG